MLCLKIGIGKKKILPAQLLSSLNSFFLQIKLFIPLSLSLFRKKNFFEKEICAKTISMQLSITKSLTHHYQKKKNRYFCLILIYCLSYLILLLSIFAQSTFLLNFLFLNKSIFHNCINLFIIIINSTFFFTFFSFSPFLFLSLLYNRMKYTKLSNNIQK